MNNFKWALIERLLCSLPCLILPNLLHATVTGNQIVAEPPAETAKLDQKDGWNSRYSKIEYLVIRQNDEQKLLKNGQTLSVVRGDIIELLDATGKIKNKSQIIVNFVGFKGGNDKNEAEDRNFPIRTNKDLLPRFSLNEEKNLYQIYAKEGSRKIAYFYIKIVRPQFSYLLIQRNNAEKMALFGEESLELSRSDSIKIIDIKTNIEGNIGVKLRVKLLSGEIGNVPLITLQKVGEKKTVIGTASAASTVTSQRRVDMVFEIVRNDEVFGRVPIAVR